MDLNYRNKIVIVTGGASGIGESISRGFAAEDATTVIFGRKEVQAQPVLDDLLAADLKAEFVRVELTDESQVIAAIDSVAERHGRIDVLVNNAGVNDSVGIDGSLDDFRSSLEKNLVQVFACTRYSVPHLAKTKGCIVNIGSKVADTGQGGTSGYAASKGGMNALTREWALALADQHIRVNCVIPAEVITPMYRNWLDSTVDDTEASIREIGKLIPLGRRTTTAEEIAATTVFVASSVSNHTTGQILYVDGGYTHLDRAFTSRPADHV